MRPQVSTGQRVVVLGAGPTGPAARGTHSRGRFGGLKYEVSSQNHSLMQGVELVNHLLLGTPQVTYWFPGTANDPCYVKCARGACAGRVGG